MGFSEKLEFLRREWPVVRQAPGSFVIAVLVCTGLVLLGASSYYNSETRKLKSDNDRYKILLGIDKPTTTTLSLLTNSELRSKAFHIVEEIRERIRGHQENELSLSEKRKEGKITEEEYDTLSEGEYDRAASAFAIEIRSAALNVYNELRRRLPEDVTLMMPVLRPADPTDPTVSLYQAFSLQQVSWGFAERLANDIDQLAKLLPSD